MNALFTIGIFLCFFLQFLLLTKKKSSASDKLLGVWMFVFGLHIFFYYLHWLDYWDIYPHLSGIHHPFPLLHGPFLYLYVLFSLRQKEPNNWLNYLHFTPALLFYIYMIPFLFFYTAEEKLMLNHGVIDDYSGFITFSIFAFIISAVSYAFASYRLLYQYESLTKQNFAYTESIDLNWLKFFIWGLGFTVLVVTVIIILEEGFGVAFGFNTDPIYFMLLITFILYLGYSGIRHKNIFSDESGTGLKILDPKSPGEYNRSGLAIDDAVKYHKDLLELMKSSKPYLDPKLKLSDLAEKMEISVNHLSQVINQHEEKNFFDFVSSFRVEEFKTRASDPSNANYSILAIALDAGFNSKSSFNQVFKKSTRQTPSEYVNAIKKS